MRLLLGLVLTFSSHFHLVKLDEKIRSGRTAIEEKIVDDGSKVNAFPGNEETRLVELLMTNYRGHGLARPVKNVTEPMDIYFRLIVEEFSDLDEQLGLVRILGTVTAIWHDVQLMWNSSTFNGIDALVLRDQQIFMPIIIPAGQGSHKAPVFHQAESTASTSIVWTDNTGLVHASVSEEFETNCKIDWTDFPVDTQHCKFIFKILRHARLKLRLLDLETRNYSQGAINQSMSHQANLTKEKLMSEEMKNDEEDGVIEAISEKATNPMWTVVGFKGEETTVTSSNGLPFSAIVYSISLRRKADYYLWNILLPTASMAVVQISVFFLPFSAERVMFSITAVLAVDIFQSSLNQKIHASSEPTPLVKYSTAQLMMGIVITIESIAVLSLTKNTSPLPKWVADLTLGAFDLKRARNHFWRCCCHKRGDGSPENQTDYWGRPRSPTSKIDGPSSSEIKANNGDDAAYPLRPFITKINDDVCVADDDTHTEIARKKQCKASRKRRQSDVVGERARLAVLIDRLFLTMIVVFFIILPVVFFKTAASDKK